MKLVHKSVLLKEVEKYLNIKKDKWYIDCTVGLGGHTKMILENGGKVLGFDLDERAVKEARKRLKSACPDAFFKIYQANFNQIGDFVRKEGIEKVDGVLFDLGVGSYHFDFNEGGFSFNSDEELDMRLDKRLKVKAKDLVNGLTKEELNELFKKVGEEERYWAVSKAIIGARSVKPIETSRELADIVRVAKGKRGRLDPATKVFMALRIVINDEINNLIKGLKESLDILDKGGKLVVISFHSGEDRVVKHFFKDNKDRVEILTKKPVTAGEDEVKNNPRARSAKLRACTKK